MNKDVAFAVYRCDKIKPFTAPTNEVFISAHRTAAEAMEEARRRVRADKSHSYVVGAS